MRAVLKPPTIKDAGDDPNATHGATLFVELRLATRKGVAFMRRMVLAPVTRTGFITYVGRNQRSILMRVK